MRDIASPQSVLLVIAAFSGQPPALDWAREQSIAAFGPLALESPRFEFSETDYYEPTMGPRLEKMFWAFERLVDPGVLAAVKRQTNAWEADYAQSHAGGVSRPLNLDPGYVGLGKLVLASTKDHAHRIYLGDGIYGEVTLRYQDRRWRPHDLTFADYRREDYQEFFTACRGYLHGRLRRAP